MKQRAAGILLPISSLPSPYGMGTLGDAAYDFVNKLVASKMTYWQVLPIGPTSYGDSPYQSFSAFAGNPYFIDLNFLHQQKMLNKFDYVNRQWFDKPDCVSYEKLWEHKADVLHLAYIQTKVLTSVPYQTFIKNEAYWLDDYALYMACKQHFDNKPWYEWDEDIKARTPKAMDKYTKLLNKEIGYFKFVQFKFFKQWNQLKDYANSQGIKIIGDIPIYISLDSADIWANPQYFQLDEKLSPKFVAGCPPDAFSADGQKWGNPLYDWDALEADDFSWWKKRMAFSAKIYDIIRIDHFIGIERYYSVPLDGSPKEGFYTTGPRKKLLAAIDSAVGSSKIIAEDLGVLTEEVKELLRDSGYPGMRVLQFAFDSGSQNIYLPHNHIPNSVLYIGTHDNDTTLGYLDSISNHTQEYLCKYLDCKDPADLLERLIAFGFASVCNTFILQMQDILSKDTTARMNFPSTNQGNWMWRMKDGEFTKEHVEKLAELCDTFDRAKGNEVAQ
ncbi:MAG: 4-alpha-glucanotransferase [Eubacteriales bacterium]